MTTLQINQRLRDLKKHFRKIFKKSWHYTNDTLKMLHTPQVRRGTIMIGNVASFERFLAGEPDQRPEPMVLTLRKINIEYPTYVSTFIP